MIEPAPTLRRRRLRAASLAACCCCAAAAVATLALPSFATQGGRGGRPEPLRPTADDLLDTAGINRIRQVELQPRDAEGRPPTIRFANGVVQRFVESRDDLNFRDFNRAGNDVQKALYIIANGDAETVADVQVATDPGSMLVFKRDVHAPVIQSCATSECHGGSNAGRFVLYGQPRTDPTVYTNFYTLARTTVSADDPQGGVFGGSGKITRRMIDREFPDQSLLLSYMLPADASDYPHPEVEGFKPAFRDARLPAFQAIRSWIGETLERTDESYDLEFEGPGQPVAEPPSTQPIQPGGANDPATEAVPEDDEE